MAKRISYVKKRSKTYINWMSPYICWWYTVHTCHTHGCEEASHLLLPMPTSEQHGLFGWYFAAVFFFHYFGWCFWCRLLWYDATTTSHPSWSAELCAVVACKFVAWRRKSVPLHARTHTRTSNAFFSLLFIIWLFAALFLHSTVRFIRIRSWFFPVFSTRIQNTRKDDNVIIRCWLCSPSYATCLILTLCVYVCVLVFLQCKTQNIKYRAAYYTRK